MVFVIVESILVYYLIAIWYLVFNFEMFQARFYYLPGIDYILKRFYPVYYGFPLIDFGPPPPRAFFAGARFMLGLEIGLVVGTIVIALFFIIKFATVAKDESLREAAKSNRRKTFLLIALEGILLYYTLGIRYFTHYHNLVSSHFPNNFLPGLKYISEIFFPLVWKYFPYFNRVPSNQTSAFLSQLSAEQLFVFRFPIALVAVAVAISIMYAYRIKVISSNPGETSKPYL